MKDDKKVKVIEVCNLGFGGIQNVVYSICKEKNSQIEYYVFGPDCEDNNIDRFKKLGVNVIAVSKKTSRMGYFNAYADTIKSIRPDCVHLHQLFTSGYMALIARVLGVKKIVIQSHNTRGRGEVGLVKKIYIFFARIVIHLCGTHFIAVSEDAARTLFFKKDINSSKYSFIRNGIDFSRFERNNLIQTDLHPFFEENVKVIISVGRLTEQKNFPFLLEIMKKIIQCDRNVRLLVAGDGEDREKLEKQKENLGLEKFVDFIGFSNNVSDLMHKADLFVLPSLWEGFGIVFLEAQACGLRCVANDDLPHEVDMGLMTYMKLEDGAEIWARKCIELLYNSTKTEVSPNIKLLFEEDYIRKQYESIYLD